MKKIAIEDLRGILVPVVTPLNKQENVDEESLRRLIRYVMKGGVHGVFILGSCGEFVALNEKQKLLIAETAVDEVNGKIPVLAGTGDTSSRRVIKNTKAMEKTGVDAVVICPPYYYPNTPEELVYHYTSIANSVNLPIILYNIPQMTKSVITSEVVEKLSEHPNIWGIKESSGDFINFLKFLYMRNSKFFKVFQGEESLISVSILCGADGGVLSIANLAPSLVVETYRYAQEGDIKKSLVCQKKVDNLCRVFEVEPSWLAALKRALHLLGVCPPYTSSSLSQASENKDDFLLEILRQGNLIK